MTNLSLPSSLELISVHIPKTAGSTFGKVILPQIYPQNQILYKYDNSHINTLIEQGKLRTETRVIHGHFPEKKYREYYPDTKMVIWLRNPINLLISHFFFWMANTNNFFDDKHRYVVENKLSFSDFLEQPYTHNIISNYFAKGMKLTDFYFVGIQEFFRDDLNDLKNKLCWSTKIQIQVANRNRYDNYQDKVIDILNNKSLIQKIVDINSVDRELYQEALSLRTQRKGLSNPLEMYKISLK
jgi:Sulfotransferase family.